MRVRVGQTTTWSKPLVSALMITRNRHALARLNVESFLRQTWPWKELIIIDDSDRFTPLSSDPRVKHVWYDRPMKMGRKHDLAIEHSQGDLLAYWDDDDWWSDERLGIQARMIVDDKADLNGFIRDLVLKLPDISWWRFSDVRVNVKTWIGNGIGLKGVPFHDGGAMWRRDIGAHLKHPDWHVTQKLLFLRRMIEDGARAKGIDNGNHFIYMRHRTNTWQFREDLKLVSADAPDWFPSEILKDYRKGVLVG